MSTGRRRRWSRLAAIGLITAGFAACGPFTPIQSVTTPVQEESVITFLDLPLKLWVRLVNHQTSRSDAGLLVARLKLENFLDTDRWLDVQVIFRDQAGFEVEKTNWEPVFLHRRKVTDYQINSLSPRPVDYRILVREAKG